MAKKLGRTANIHIYLTEKKFMDKFFSAKRNIFYGEGVLIFYSPFFKK